MEVTAGNLFRTRTNCYQNKKYVLTDTDLYLYLAKRASFPVSKWLKRRSQVITHFNSRVKYKNFYYRDN